MADLVGQQLGNYRLTRLLGRGGFAEVYLGEHIHLKTQVAIRVLPPQSFMENDDERRSEIQRLARLKHPNILNILDFDLVGRTPYIVEEYATNGTLRQQLHKGTQLPLNTIIPYVRQIASALDYIHAQRIIHRNIKPENIFIGQSNQILLSDFGIEVTSPDLSSPARTGSVAGTTAYTAPEQLQRRPLPASDQYSLGIVVYEWLSGNLPFQGSFIDMAYQQISALPSPLREKVPTISPGVEQVVMTALAKDPKLRFSSVGAFADELEKAARFGRSTMDKCPYCSAETRPGDNFCLNCGNRLVPSTPPPQQAQPEFGDATIPVSEDWVPPVPEASSSPQESEWRDDENQMTIANTSTEPPASPVDASAANSSASPVAQAIMDKVEKPARLILRTDTGEVLHEYPLEKAETTIGRAPTSDILLSKDKLTSRRHATVTYDNGNYVILDERSANGTFVNGQQLEEMTPRTLHDGDHIGIGEHELVFQAYQSASSGVDNESMPTITVSPSAVADITYRTREDELLTAAADDFNTRSMEGSGVEVWQESASASSSLTNQTVSARSPVEKNELSLFAITNVVLEEGNVAFVGKMYALQAGIARNKPDDFRGEQFKLAVENVAEPITFDILLQESENIELITSWHRRLRYRPDNAEPQLATFKFHVVGPGKSFLVVDYYHERRWLRTMRFEFDAVEQS